MNSRFLLSLTIITGLLMPSFFYAMELDKVTFVPKKESFVIAPDKKINSYALKDIAMDQGSNGQLLALALENDAGNSFIYAINPQKKTWQLIHRSDDQFDVISLHVCDDSIFICKNDKIIRWNATKKSCEDMVEDRRMPFPKFAVEKDAHGRRIAVVDTLDEIVLMDLDTHHVIDRELAGIFSVNHPAITHLSNGSTLFAKSFGSDIRVKVAGDKRPPLVINKGYNRHDESIFLYEDMHKRPTLINYNQTEGSIDVYDASTGALCINKQLKYATHFEFRKKDGRVLMALSHSNEPKVEIFDISDRDVWKLISTCAVNDARWYKKKVGLHIDDFGYPHLASITQRWNNPCWPLQLWEPKERAHTLAQIKSALRTHLPPDGIAHTILGYAGSAEHAHAIDRYNAPQENSEVPVAELPIAPIGAEGLSEGRLQVYEGPAPAHPSWFVRNQRWLNWLVLGCSIAPLVMLAVSIIKNRRG